MIYTLSPQGSLAAAPEYNVFFFLTTNVDLPDLDNLTADIVPSTFAEPCFQPGDSLVPGSKTDSS